MKGRRIAYGGRCYRSVAELIRVHADEIVASRNAGVPVREIAERYGAPYGAFAMALSREAKANPALSSFRKRKSYRIPDIEGVPQKDLHKASGRNLAAALLVAGFSVEEIAGMMGKTVSYVRQRLSDARLDKVLPPGRNYQFLHFRWRRCPPLVIAALRGLPVAQFLPYAGKKTNREIMRMVEKASRASAQA